MHGEVLALAWPSILSNLSVPLLGAVDTALVGRLDEIHTLGAVAVGAMVFSILYWAFGFLRMGTTGLTAQALGAGDDEEVQRILARALLVAAAGAAALVLLQRPLEAIAFRVVEASPEVEASARAYFRVRILAAPATLALYAFNGWFLGLQNARYSLYLAVMSNVLNIVLDYVFVAHLGWRAEGIAAGTVISQYAGLGLALVLHRRLRGHVFPRIRIPGVLDRAALIRFAGVNRDILIRTLCLMFTFSFFTARSAAAGDEVLAANSILFQLWSIMAYFVDGFAFAGESLVGRYRGAGDEAGLRRAIRLVFAWGMATAAVFSLVYGLAGESILGIFTDKADLIGFAMAYFGWTVAAPLVNTPCFLWDGIFIGVTASVAMRNSMLVATGLVFLPVWWFARGPLGNHGLWLAMTCFMVARGVTLSVLAPAHVLRPGRDPRVRRPGARP